MSEIKVASRYAKSLLDLAKEQKAVEEVNKDMDFFYKAVKQHAELRALLANPIVSGIDKKAILAKLFGTKVSKLTTSFFAIMIDKKREDLLYVTAKEFFNLYNQYKGIIIAKVVSATPLTDAASKDLIAVIEKATKMQVQLKASVDANLIGGFILTIGDRQFDTSLVKGLNGLRKEFSINNFVATV